LGDPNSPDRYFVSTPGFLTTDGQEAVKSIGTRAVPFLLRWISAASAATALHLLGPDARTAIPDLVRLATDREPTNIWVNVGAARALGQIGLSDPVALFAVATNGFPKLARLELFEQFRGTNAAAAAPALAACINDPDKEIVVMALQALAQVRSTERGIFNSLVELADTPDPKVRRPLLDALARFGASSLPIMERAMDNEDKYVRMAAINALASAGPHATPSIIRGLTDSNGDVRWDAVYALVRSAPESLTNREVLKIGAAGLGMMGERKKTGAMLLKAAGERARGVTPDLMVRSIEDWERFYRAATNSLRNLAPDLVGSTSP
jgi:HEAT repeat protein